MSYHKEQQHSARVDSIVKLLQMIHSEATDPHSAEYIREDCKYDLVMLRYEIDKMVRNTPMFGKEADWEKEITMKILKES